MAVAMRWQSRSEVWLVLHDAGEPPTVPRKLAQ
jgi:hypothetical protein